MRLFIFSALTAASFGLSAAAQAEPVQDLLKCAEITQADARLACYDQVATGVRANALTVPQTAPQVATAPEAAAPSPPPPPKKKKGGWWIFGGHKEEAAPAPSAPPAPVETASNQAAPSQIAQPAPAPALTPEGQFGAERMPKPEAERAKPEKVDEIHVAVDDYAFNAFGKIIVFLKNGQVWRQLQSDNTKFRLRQETTYTAKVSRGVLGSYVLSFDGLSGSAKVTRIK